MERLDARQEQRTAQPPTGEVSLGAQRFTYRKAVEADLPGMFPLWWEMQTFHAGMDAVWYTPMKQDASRPVWMEHLRASIADPDSIIYVALSESEVVGMVKASIIGRPPLLEHRIKVIGVENAIVTERFRRLGVFRELMTLVTAEGRLRGATAMKLSVYSGNPARSAYESLGFTTHELGLIKYL